MEATAEGRLQFGQQQLAMDLAEKIKTLAENTQRLQRWADNPQGKRPPVSSNVARNIKDALAKLRSFAMPESSMGARLVELCEGVEDTLIPEGIVVDALKTNYAYVDSIHGRAQKAHTMLCEGVDELFAGFGE